VKIGIEGICGYLLFSLRALRALCGENVIPVLECQEFVFICDYKRVGRQPLAFTLCVSINNQLFRSTMRTRVSILFVIICSIGVSDARAENPVLTADKSLPIPKLSFDAKGDLQISASPGSSAKDFDFLVGKWNMHNRHLNKRLANCHDWTEFDSTDVNTKILNAAADTDTYSTTQFPGMEGKLFEGLTLRLFDPQTRLWSLYWIASNTGRVEPPVVGSFDANGVGHFFGKDTLNGKPIIVVFRWDARNKNRPVWGQSFSPDNGKTWEWNFFNVCERPR
jgi:hypothetical protein